MLSTSQWLGAHRPAGYGTVLQPISSPRAQCLVVFLSFSLFVFFYWHCVCRLVHSRLLATALWNSRSHLAQQQQLCLHMRVALPSFASARVSQQRDLFCYGGCYRNGITVVCYKFRGRGRFPATPALLCWFSWLMTRFHADTMAMMSYGQWCPLLNNSYESRRVPTFRVRSNS